MSSSKIFKQDPLFTPMSLVRRTLQPPGEEQPQAMATAVPRDRTSIPAPEEPMTGRTSPAGIVPEEAPDLDALRQEAYNQGMADLAAQYQAEFSQTMEALARACRKIDNQRRKLLDHSRGDLINLIIALSEKILRHELTTPRNVIAATLESALEQAIESEEFYVTLHPDDLAFAESRAPELITAIRGLARLHFKTDPALTRGGCMLESTACTVNASIEAQLASMGELLLEEPAILPVAIEPPPPPEHTSPPGLDLSAIDPAPEGDT